MDGQIENIKIFYDQDEKHPTLEYQLLKANSLEVLNNVLGKVGDKAFKKEDDLLTYMKNNKTDVSLKIFNSNENLSFPDYINDAIRY